MKKNKLKIITITLLVILLTMIAFIGVYAQVQNRMENKVKDYKLSMDLEGARIVTLTANKDTTETIKDSDGNVIESATDEEIAEKGYTKEEIPNNSEEELNIDNFNKSKKIIQDRLKKLNVENYVVRLNEKTGDIVIELPENTQTDEIVGNINTVGKLEIIDSETKEVLLNNDTIKASNALRSTSSTGTTVFLTIEFNSEGKKKLEEITKTYIPNPEESESQNDEQNTTENETTEETNTTSETTNTEEAENTQTTDTDTSTDEETQENTEETTESSEEEAKEKTITLKIDDTEIMTTSFDEPITDGVMHLSLGQASTDIDTITDNARQAQRMTAIITYGNMPIQYDISSNQYIKADVSEELTNIVIIGGAIIIAIALIFLMIKYKSTGLLSAISYVGLLSILLLIIRYTNVMLSIEGIAGIFIVLILNYIYTNSILSNLNKAIKNKKDKELNVKHVINTAIKDISIKIIPIFILAIVFSFIGWIPTNSFGMVMFWGLALIIIYNLVVTKNLLKYSKEK